MGSTQGSLTPRPQVFYGWWVVVASLLVLFVGSGMGFYGFGIFSKPLMEEFGWKRAPFFASTTIYFVTIGLASPLMGTLITRYKVRKTMVLGAVLAGLGFLLLSQISSLWQFYAAYFLIGAGHSGMMLVPTATVVSNWFLKKRGLAMGITISGLGFGGLVLAPTMNYLIMSVGWRLTFAILGLVTWAVVIPLSALVIRWSPQEMGLRPDGETMPSAVTGTMARQRATTPPWTLSEAVRTPAFWIVAFVFFMAALGSVSVAQHQVPLLTDRGFSATAAAAAFGLTGLLSTGGKLFFGFLADVFSCRYSLILCFGLQVVALVVLLTTHSLVMVWLFVILFAPGMGAIPALRPLLTSECFGISSFGPIYGAIVGLAELAQGIGPLMAGYIFDVTQSYDAALIFFIAMFGLGSLTLFFARPPQSKKVALPQEG